MMQDLDAYRLEVEKRLTQFNLSNHPLELYEPINYILQLGGKRIRPMLTMLACQLFGQPGLTAIDAGIAIELFHNFTLVHDDIMDKAPLRRGKTAVHKKWNNQRALLSGDTLFVIAYQQLVKSKTKNLSELIAVFSNTAQEVCEGQQMDMDFESRSFVTINEYIEMVRLKTAVLLAGALEMGAIIGEAKENDRKHIYHFGEHIGIAFQLQDDLLDVYATDTFGKQCGGDIIANKKTFLHIKAKELANSTQKKLLSTLASEQNYTKKVTETISIFNDLNVQRLTENEIQHHFELALCYLDKISTSEESKTTLKILSNQLMKRKI